MTSYAAAVVSSRVEQPNECHVHVHVDVSLIPGLHKRGLDLPLSRRLAFRKCRGRGGLGVAIAFFVLVTFLLQHRAVHRMVIRTGKRDTLTHTHARA